MGYKRKWLRHIAGAREGKASGNALVTKVGAKVSSWKCTPLVLLHCQYERHDNADEGCKVVVVTTPYNKTTRCSTIPECAHGLSAGGRRAWAGTERCTFRGNTPLAQAPAP
eukprot:1160714-Pelagomonas_calceolata.AAC.11